MARQHRIFGGKAGSNYVWGEKIVIESLKKDGYTGFLILDGRLEAYLNDDLVWTSYFISQDYAEAEFRDIVDMITGKMYA